MSQCQCRGEGAAPQLAFPQLRRNLCSINNTVLGARVFIDSCPQTAHCPLPPWRGWLCFRSVVIVSKTFSSCYVDTNLSCILPAPPTVTLLKSRVRGVVIRLEGRCIETQIGCPGLPARTGRFNSFNIALIEYRSVSRYHVQDTQSVQQPNRRVAATCTAQSRAHSQLACRTRFSTCLLYTSPSPRDRQKSRMPSSA